MHMTIWPILIAAGVIAGLPMQSKAGEADLGLNKDDFGTAVVQAAERIGEPLGMQPVGCEASCVWMLSPHVTLTVAGGEAGRARGASVAWDMPKPDEAGRDLSAFSKGCRALVAALRPDWPGERITEFVRELSRPRASTPAAEEKQDGVSFVVSTDGSGRRICEARPG